MLLKETKILIIGAGLAGLTCARALSERGLSSVIYEKSRGVGGRLATRRSNADVSFDHGGQYVTAQGDKFQAYLDEAIKSGFAAEWLPNLEEELKFPKKKIVGLSGMSDLVRPLCRELDIRFNVTVTGVSRQKEGWLIRTDKSHKEEIFDKVILTIPAPQAKELIYHETSIISVLDKVSLLPCLAAMVAFSEKLNLSSDVFRDGSEVLAWCARDSSKPQRNKNYDSWVLHGTPRWSKDWLEAERDIIAEKLLENFRQTYHNPLPEIKILRGHKWRYALADKMLGKEFLASDDNTLFLGGDWCMGPRAEYAYNSGRAIAAAVI